MMYLKYNIESLANDKESGSNMNMNMNFYPPGAVICPPLAYQKKEEKKTNMYSCCIDS